MYISQKRSFIFGAISLLQNVPNKILILYAIPLYRQLIKGCTSVSVISENKVVYDVCYLTSAEMFLFLIEVVDAVASCSPMWRA